MLWLILGLFCFVGGGDNLVAVFFFSISGLGVQISFFCFSLKLLVGSPLERRFNRNIMF